jgi:ribosomal protein S17E
LNKVRKLAEELLTKYPTMFSTNFDSNKKALEKVAIIRNRALRNQIAGTITSMVSERTPGAKQPEIGTEIEDLMSSSSDESEARPEESTAAAAEVSQQAQ